MIKSGINIKTIAGGWRLNIPPHITLVPPFPTTEVKVLDERAQEIPNLYPTFRINASGIRRFSGRSNTVYLEVDKSQELMSLQHDLARKSSKHTNYKFDDDFIPHITLANRIHKARADETVEEIQSADLSVSFICSGFSLMVKSPKDNMWRLKKKFLL